MYLEFGVGIVSRYLAKAGEGLWFSGREEWIGVIVLFDTTNSEPNFIMSRASDLISN